MPVGEATPANSGLLSRKRSGAAKASLIVLLALAVEGIEHIIQGEPGVDQRLANLIPGDLHLGRAGCQDKGAIAEVDQGEEGTFPRS